MAAPDGGRALPLLSGLAPRTEAASNAPRCHRCNREFGILTRRKYCNHCGYAYCGNCCDHQALCPRTDAGYRPGYETVVVCTYCIEMLSITASGKSQLRGMTVQRLRTYLDAYGIKPKSVLEKDDLIEAIIDARGLNGCLSSENEKFYRRYTIARRSPPDTRQRGANTSSNDRSNGPVPPQRPRSTDPRLNAGNRPTAQQSRSPPPPMPSRSSDPYSQNPQHNRPMSPRQEQSAPTWSPPRSPPPLRFPTPHHAPNTYPRPNSPPPQPRWQTRPQSPTAEPRDQPWPPSGGRSRSRSVPSSEAPNPNVNRPPPPPPPPSSPRPRAPQAVPLLATIVGMTREDLSLYNVATLKGILQANHVNARLILEKSELIDKVMILIETEMRERAREQAIHEAEERAMREQQRIRQEQLRAEAGRRVQETASQDSHPSRARSPPPPERPTSPRPAPTVSTGYVERDGLCVVCQDEEANVAIVDCGHLALCMGCSDTIMKSTRECPLCRTRIVTEQRLLRIFKS